jgi:hypothetical protein
MFRKWTEDHLGRGRVDEHSCFTIAPRAPAPKSRGRELSGSIPSLDAFSDSRSLGRSVHPIALVYHQNDDI